MYRQWVPCGRMSSYSFPPTVLELCRMMFFCIEWRYACGLGTILWIFFSLFLLCELKSFFFTWNFIKVFRQWVSFGRNSSYSFPPIVLKLCRCFLHEMKICVWFGYNTSISIKVCRQWVPCGCNASYSFVLIVLKLCRWNEDVHVVLV